MGVKTARHKQARRELKKAHVACEHCCYCKKKVLDLEAHIAAEHNFVCVRCGQRFSKEVHWKQHMNDKHGLKATAAVREDRHKKLERWTKKNKQTAAGFEDSAPVDEEAGEGSTTLSGPAPCHQHICELCGASAILPYDLIAQGLTFNCSYLGRRCGAQAAGVGGACRLPVPAAQQQAVAAAPVSLFMSSAPTMGTVFGQGPAFAARPQAAPAPPVDAEGDAAIAMAVPSDDEDL
mmetsp:Transcript_121395/g.259200  ORF Transcript_121395/g.259200 Transcript_121395/m.259200 type:complete len:235 (+) Transcript_121395:138-842(+)